MNILITGGTGLIGSALVESLVRDGHNAWVLTRQAQPAGLPAGARAIQWDGQTPHGWQEWLEQAHAVVNLAGENIGDLPWTNERKRSIRASRVEAGQVLVKAIAASTRRPGVLVQSSAIGYYGPHLDETITERASHGNDYLSSVAVDWEASSQPVEGLGVRRVVARTGVVLSPRGGVLSRFLYPVRLFAGGPMGSGRQWVSWIHITDQVRALRFLIENEAASGAFNLSVPEPVTNAEFVRTLGQVLNRPSWLPAPALALKALLGEMSTLVLDGQRVLPQRLLELGFRFQFERLEAALVDLLKDETAKVS